MMMKKKVDSENSFKLIVFSAIIGVLAGFTSVAYRYALTSAEHVSIQMYEYVLLNKKYIPILFVLLAIIGLLVGVLIKKFPLISGSGIPQLKAEVSGNIQGDWFKTLVFKFLGGVLSIIGGLSLGREGPSIQLGASVANGVASNLQVSETEKRILLASGASAGLASAFNAPLAGVMFAIEEVFKYFSRNILISTLVAATCADFTSRIFFGNTFSFNFKITNTIPVKHIWIVVILGIAIGLLGVLYNVTLLKTQALYKIIEKKLGLYKMIIPFIIAGGIGLTFPIVMGGGHHIITELNIQTSMVLLIMMFVVKFLFSMISFGSGAPGGIFFPLLVLGGLLGGVFARIVIPILGLDPSLFYNFVVIAMASYFTVIVRAPMTGIVLMIEMTGNMNQLLPMIISSTIGYLTAEKLHNDPIYDSLLKNLLQNSNIGKKRNRIKKLQFEAVVHHNSIIENQTIKSSDILPECMIVSVERNKEEFIPNGDTIIRAGDLITILTTIDKEAEVRKNINSLIKGYK